MKTVHKLIKYSLISFLLITINKPEFLLAKEANITTQIKQNQSNNTESLIKEIQSLRQQGKINEAISLVEKEIAQAGKNTPTKAFWQNQLGEIYLDEGNYKAAEMALQEAKNSLNNNLNNELGANILNNLGLLYYEQGKYELAQSNLQQALTTLETITGKDSMATYSTLNYLGDLARAQANYPQAESYYQRNLSILKSNLGEQHPLIAVTLNDLASLYTETEQYQKAEPLFQEALKIAENSKENPLIAATLNNLANLYGEQKRFTEAEPLLQRALSLLEQSEGPNSANVASSLNNLATIYSDQGNYSQAEPLLNRALGIFKQVKGNEHPDIATTLANLSWVKRQTGNLNQAIDLLTQATEIEEKNISVVLASGSESQKQAYMNKLADSTKAAISLHVEVAPNNPQALNLALTTVLRRKGRILDALADNIQALRDNLTPEDQVLLDQWANIRSQLSSLIFKGVGSANPEQSQQEIASLKAKAEQIENTLFSKSAQFRTKSEAVTIDKVQQLIPSDGVLVEMVSYQPYDSVTKDWSTSPRYLAYILPKQGAPTWVDLGDAATINSAMVSFRKSIVSRSNTVKQTGKTLYDLVFAPIRKIVGNTPKILLSPDSQLNLMPFAALTDENGKYLLENYSIIYLSTGRDILRLQNVTKAQNIPVIMADPDYERPGNAPSGQILASNNVVDYQRSSSFSTQLATLKVGPLPGTALEARAISPLFDSKIELLTGSNATENALKQVKSPLFLHIATHGFFFSKLKNENPLLRSGLALAGFNPRQSGSEDGVLTALETAGLNLNGTKLVVLSACETGLGEVAEGEGVYGLRRALVMAGSETQIISLWSVDDTGTKDLMVGYYQGIYKGEPRAEALRVQQLKMLGNPQYEHPFYWAPFILSGAWDQTNLIPIW